MTTNRTLGPTPASIAVAQEKPRRHSDRDRDALAIRTNDFALYRRLRERPLLLLPSCCWRLLRGGTGIRIRLFGQSEGFGLATQDID
jgi:hypothetical protein